MLKNTAQRRD